MTLDAYRKKRNFKKTPEPKGKIPAPSGQLYVMQKHAASHLHYDLRLQLDGVLKSWAVPKGPCLDPDVKRLAIAVEDHPVAYGSFQGIIPKGEYGGGTVMLWDEGSWHPLDEDPRAALATGHLRFLIDGKKLKGQWDLIRFRDKQWFLRKHRDGWAKALTDYDITTAEPLSILSGQTMAEISAEAPAIWHSKSTATKKKTEFSLEEPCSPFPQAPTVMLATLVNQPPTGEDWLYEVKWDGYRILALKQGGNVTLLSRRHHDWTAKFPDIVAALKSLAVANAIFDGEIVVLDANSRSDFQLLQNALQTIQNKQFYFYIFDLLYLEKWDLRQKPFIERKKYLKKLLNDNNSSLKFSAHLNGDGSAIFKKICSYGLEGIIAKKSASIYDGKRSKNWLKIKCNKRQEFLICGYTLPQGNRDFFGALYLGFYNEKKELTYAGKVGTGFNDESLAFIYKKMLKLRCKKNPFIINPPGVKTAVWIKPVLIAEIEFSEWTSENRLRHPSFKGLRDDKEVCSITKESVFDMNEEGAMAAEKTTLTHKDKLLYPEDNISKKEIYAYYEKISSYILPYIRNRPLTLVRCPQDYQHCFYQKHLQKNSSGLHNIILSNNDDKQEEGIYLVEKKGLLSLAQMAALEIHPWGSTIQNLHNPDIIIFDLDPGPDVPWKTLVEYALLVKEELEQIKLQVFVKTTGGKGLHLVLPIVAEYDWEIIKKFTHTFVVYLEKKNPHIFVSNMAKSKRHGKIFIDYLRNQWQATAVAPFSLRARAQAPVATPVFWHELTKDYYDTFYTIRSIEKRLNALKKDPWHDFFIIKQRLPL